MFKQLNKLWPLLILASLEAFSAPKTIGPLVQKAADQSYDSLLKTYWRPKNRNFVGKTLYWFYAQSIDVASMAVKRNPSELNRSRLKELIDAQKSRGLLQGRQVYFDDENWMSIALIRAYKVTGNKSYLSSATVLFEDILKRATRKEGGFWWNYEKKQVATAINAGAVITSVMLWKETGNTKYLNVAKKTYAYWRKKMTSEDGLKIYDNFVEDRVNQTTFSYDQGLMVGASLELYKVTNQKEYLTQSRGYAEYMIQNMKSDDGIMIEEFCITMRAGCIGSRDLAQFKGIAVLYLVELAKASPKDRILRGYLALTAKALINNNIFDRKIGKIAYEWDGSELASNGTYQTTNSGALALGALATLFR